MHRLILFLWRVLLFVVTTSILSGAAGPPLRARVLVVFNPDVHASKRVAEWYMMKRNIPAQNLCSIKPGRGSSMDISEAITSQDLLKAVIEPIRVCLDRVGRNQILYIVLAYGMPFRISDVPKGYGKAVDQRLVDIWQKVSNGSPAANPYHAGVQAKLAIYPAFVSFADYRDEKNAPPIYSVWRLDGHTEAMAKELVDKALTAERNGLHGQACIDRRFGSDLSAIDDTGYNAGDWALHRAAQFLRDFGIPVLEDTNEAEFGTPPAPLRCEHAIFYAGWYSFESYYDAFSWEVGAIGFHLDSASATNPRSGKSWSANAIARGITVTSGAIDEPYLGGLPRPDGIVHDLLAGANVGDAFLRNTTPLNWMIINIGDPLYRPSWPTKAAAGSR